MAASACDDRLPSIDKLDQCNWPVWKLQIKTYLEARDLWKTVLVTSGACCTGNDEAIAAFAQQSAKYQIRVARVKSILSQMVSTGQLHVIVTARGGVVLVPRDPGTLTGA